MSITSSFPPPFAPTAKDSSLYHWSGCTVQSLRTLARSGSRLLIATLRKPITEDDPPCKTLFVGKIIPAKGTVRDRRAPVTDQHRVLFFGHVVGQPRLQTYLSPTTPVLSCYDVTIRSLLFGCLSDLRSDAPRPDEWSIQVV